MPSWRASRSRGAPAGGVLRREQNADSDITAELLDQELLRLPAPARSSWDTVSHAVFAPPTAATRLSVTQQTPDLSGLHACAGKCRCSYDYGVLGIDSSHLFLLARSAAAAAADSSSARWLLDLLRAHACAGQRRLVTSATCLESECFRSFRPVADGGDRPSLSDICSGIEYGEVGSIIKSIPDGASYDLPLKVEVQARVLSFDRGERSLVEVLRDVDGAAIVTNDEDAFDVIKELVETNVISLYPMMSLTLMESMYNCHALTAAQASMVCDQAVASIEPRTSEAKRRRKVRQAEQIVQRIATAEAVQRMNTLIHRSATPSAGRMEL